jgi:hypothetical protein
VSINGQNELLIADLKDLPANPLEKLKKRKQKRFLVGF